MEPWRQDAGLGLSGAVQSSPVLAQLSKALSLGKTIDKGGERDVQIIRHVLVWPYPKARHVSDARDLHEDTESEQEN